MPYLPNIPIATQTLKSSQPQILSNFQTSNSVYGVDHYDYTVTGTDLGHHKNVTMPVLVTPPTPSANQFTIYSKTVSGSSELFAKRDGFPTEYQLTSGGNINISAAAGYTPLARAVTLQATYNTGDRVNPTGYSIISSIGVASMVPNVAPNWQMTFTTPMASANYYVSIALGNWTSTTFGATTVSPFYFNRTVNSLFIQVPNLANLGAGPFTTEISVMIFGT
jgi:hypothetical protein